MSIRYGIERLIAVIRFFNIAEKGLDKSIKIEYCGTYMVNRED